MRKWVNKQKRKKEWKSPFFRFLVNLASNSLTLILVFIIFIVLHRSISVVDFLVISTAWVLIAILSAILDK